MPAVAPIRCGRATPPARCSQPLRRRRQLSTPPHRTDPNRLTDSRDEALPKAARRQENQTRGTTLPQTPPQPRTVFEAPAVHQPSSEHPTRGRLPWRSYCSRSLRLVAERDRLGGVAKERQRLLQVGRTVSVSWLAYPITGASCRSKSPPRWCTNAQIDGRGLMSCQFRMAPRMG